MLEGFWPFVQSWADCSRLMLPCYWRKIFFDQGLFFLGQNFLWQCFLGFSMFFQILWWTFSLQSCQCCSESCMPGWGQSWFSSPPVSQCCQPFFICQAFHASYESCKSSLDTFKQFNVLLEMWIPDWNGIVNMGKYIGLINVHHELWILALKGSRHLTNDPIAGVHYFLDLLVKLERNCFTIWKK